MRAFTVSSLLASMVECCRSEKSSFRIHTPRPDSEESVGGVSMAVLVRRVERPENAPKHAPVTDTKQAIEALRRDTLSGKCVTKNSKKRPLTRENAFRPKSPMGMETGLAGTASASVLDPELKNLSPAERSGAGVFPGGAERSRANQIPGL